MSNLASFSITTAVLCCLSGLAFGQANKTQPIDRHALVSRHNVVLTKFDDQSPVQVGNGEFAFGLDITGLQTFIPFNIMSQWGWHSGAPPMGQKVEDYQMQMRDTHGRQVPYPLTDPLHPVLSNWLASSPHRINLGRIGMVLIKKDGSEATIADLRNPHQTLDLWTGVVTSHFEIDGEPITVKTAGHPTQDSIGAHIQSPLIPQGRLSVFLSCPGNNPAQFTNFVGDWTNPGQFQPLAPVKANQAIFTRNIDEVNYQVGLKWQGNAVLNPPSQEAIPLEIVSAMYGANNKWIDVTNQVTKFVSKGRLSVPVGNSLAPDPILGVVKYLKVTYRVGPRLFAVEAKENDTLVVDSNPNRNRFRLSPSGNSDTLAFACTFSPTTVTKDLPDGNQTLTASRESWPKFWQSGGALDLSGSTDPRWKELERRVVLSQYLMSVNEAGSNPPQESGLVNNGWFGRWHMEMVWWHATHYALWNRWYEVNPSLNVYSRELGKAKALAKTQGYLGARWPKCIGPDGREWPHEIHSFLAWQQPHPIFFAELDYRAHPTKATLLKWQPIVEATADFMASYAFYDKNEKRYVLGPPIHLVSENALPTVAKNPTFELGYWRFGLRTAQAWRKRLKLAPNAEWQKVLKGLAPLPVQDGVYVLHEDVEDMWTKWNFEHPALIGTYGMLPGDGVDVPTMRRTLDRVSKTWNFDRTWGWDFPMLAMSAARLGEPNRAIDFLLTSAPGFQFDQRGLATGGPFPYFPSNGGLLYAVAMMAAGWDGAPKKHAPGFPADGKWNVRYEGLRPAL